mgnify:FL=1
MAGTGVGKFSSTAGSNTANMTVNFAENMAPSNVNNAARELMGHIRDMYEQLGDGYFEFGDGDGTYTIARVDADTLTVASASDLSALYFAGRKIRVTDGGANVVEGTIASTSHGSSLQTVNLTGISLASGTPTKVELGIDTAAFGGKLILDDDGDTYLEAPTDDTIDIYVAGAKDFVITANTFTAESGSTIAAQALTATTVTASGIVKTDDATDATSTTDGSLQTDGGLSVAKDAILGNDLKLLSDSAVLVFGAGSDATITHTNDTGLTLNSTNKLMFNDASQFIQGSSATVLSIGATDEIDLTATAVDLNGTLNVSGVATFQATPVFPDGSLAVADLDIDGATDIGAAIVDADLFIIDDGAGGTNRKAAASRLKTYIGATDLDGAVVINESSADVDFRVESNGNANMLIVDGGANAVLVGTATHDGNATFTVSSASNGSRPAFFLNGGEVATSTFGTRFKMSVTRDDNTSDLMVAGDNTADRFRIFSDGDVVNHDNSYGAISDSRIKSNIVDANSQWNDIKAVKVRNYKKNDDIAYYSDAAWVQIGVIAQELEAAGMDKLVKDETKYISTDPEVIAGDKNVGDIRGYKSVKYSVLYMKAIKALQEAMTRIETLETKVTALEG